jgi:hypothetical protein
MGSVKTDQNKNSTTLTSAGFLAKAKNIHTNFSEKGKPVKHQELYHQLDELLKKSNLTQLLTWGDIITNNSIVNQVLASCDLLPYQYIDSIGVRLAQLSGTDNVTIEKVFAYCKSRKKQIIRNRILLIAVIILIACLFFFFVE